MRTVGQPFPEFASQSCVGPDLGSLCEINSGTIRGQWAVFVFYPKDFTFVCPTELVEFNNSLAAFAERGAKVFGGSTDNEYSHMAWCESHPQLKGLKYPLLAANKLANDLGILDDVEYVCQRATFIVDPEGIIQWAGIYNTKVGRSTAEVLRVLDALQSDGLTPCNWQKGDAFVNA